MSSDREDGDGPGTPARRRRPPRPPLWPSRLAARWGLEPSALPNQEERERHASWLELFFDLVFVLALLAVQQRLHGDSPSALEVLRTAGLYVVVWWAWGGQAFYDTRFDPDDFPHRLAVLVCMLGAGSMAIGAEEAPETLLLPIGYLVVRGTLLALYLRVRGTSPEVRSLTTVYLVGFGTSWLLWAASLAAPVDTRPLLWIVALAIDQLTPVLGRRRLNRHPVHPGHLPERIGQFTIILLGVSLTDLLDAVPARPSAAVILTALVAFAIPASLWWTYSTFVTTEASGGGLRAGVGYAAVHGLLGGALLLLGWTLGQIVRSVVGDAPELSGILRLLTAVSLGTWVLCGLTLHRITLGHLLRQRVILAAVTIALIAVTSVFMVEPVTLLPPLALIMIGYSIVATQVTIRFAEEQAIG